MRLRHLKTVTAPSKEPCISFYHLVFLLKEPESRLTVLENLIGRIFYICFLVLPIPIQKEYPF